MRSEDFMSDIFLSASNAAFHSIEITKVQNIILPLSFEKMALKESEIRVLAILALIILILWAFFGLFWSLLLVFTFLIYAYNFGRQRNANVRHERVDNEPDVTLFQEKLPDDRAEFQDLSFTGLPKGQFTLRSPMPLLSEVTKRLSFNTSTVTPFQARKTWNNSRELGTPFLSRGNSVVYCRRSNHFSLLNPALQRPSTVKIASPDVTKTFTLSNSPLKRITPDYVNPCSRASVLSALKESRKRSFAVDDDEDPELILRPTKRRGTKPVNSEKADSTHEVTRPLSRSFFGGLKRAAIRDSKEVATEDKSNKRSKVIEHSVSSETGRNQRQAESVLVVQKRRSVETNSLHDTTGSEEDSEESKSKKAKNSSPVVDQEDQRPTTVEREDTQMVTDSVAHAVSKSAHDTDTQMSDTELKESSTKNSSSSETEDVDANKPQQTNVSEVKSGDLKNKGSNSQPPVNKDTSTVGGRKRFTVPRFLSKEDSRRRAVPVYCASNEESEMPQRRTVTRKINQEQMKIDRKLAWERVKKFLDDDDDEGEEDEESEASKSAVSSATTATCTSSSLFKIPAAHAVTSVGTVTMTTTQSLITPVLATGMSGQVTGPLGNLASTVAQTSRTTQANSALTQSQASVGPLVQSKQALGSGLLTNLASVQGASTTVSTTLPVATAKQGNLLVTSCTSGTVNSLNPSTTGLQANTALTSTATNLVTGGFQVSSASSFGNSPFTKPAKTDQSTSLSNPAHKNTPAGGFQFGANFSQSSVGSSVATTQDSTQKVGSSFPVVSSSIVSGASNNTAASVLGRFNFAAPGGSQTGFSLNKTVSQSTPGAESVNNPSALTMAPSTSQNVVAFGSNTSTVTQSPFRSLASTAQGTPSSSSSLSGFFGQSANTAQNSFALTTQSKGAFGSTNMQPLPGSTQPAQTMLGGFSTNSTLGTSLDKSSKPSPFSQTAFGVQANQNASQTTFGANPTQNAFGAQQSQPASQKTFGGKSAFNPGAVKNQFTCNSQANQTTDKNTFGSQAARLTFGSQLNNNATQSGFGSQSTQNTFGALLNQSATQSPFGTQATQNTFGAQLNQSATQSPFGAPTCTNQASKSSFSFAANTARNSSNPTFGSFGNNAATPSQNAVAPTGRFNFSSPAANSTAVQGGFNFSATDNKTGSFQFGSGNTSSFSSFGQTAAQTGNPVGTPATPTPTPTGGFNFAAGSSGMMGSPFGSPTPGPSFGAPSTPQGANSALTAKTRARLAARRRGKK